MVRARASAQTRKMALSRAETTMTLRCTPPTHNRATCGITSPTKAMPPDTATTAAMHTATTTSSWTRARVGDTPRDRADSSPMASASSRRDQNRSTAMQASTMSPQIRTDCQSARPSEPSSQNSTSCAPSALCAAKTMKLVRALNT
jgi:hypothetical protein